MIFKETTTAFTVTPMVTCKTCEQPVSHGQAQPLRIVENAGYSPEGIKQLRSTGETTYECGSCWGAYFTELEAEYDGGDDAA